MSDRPNVLLQPDMNGFAAPANAVGPPMSWADAMSFNVKAIGDEVARQRQIAADRRLWTGGGVLEGGHPTAAGVVDAANQTAQGVLMGTTAPGPVRAFHGSPYDFNAFDTSKIGTGEGAQAYGHGLYFAENEGTAKAYRDALSRTDYSTSTGGRIPDWVGNSITRAQDDPNLVKGVINGHLQDFQSRLAEAQAEAQTSHQPWLAQDQASGLQQIIDSLQQLRSGDATMLPRGRMYEVGINADPDQFLHWDKTLDEQSPYVQAQLEKTSWYPFAKDQLERKGNDNPTGRDLHHWLMDDFDPHEGATMLNDAGIPGIRYLDQGSRGKGEGSHNYVVFDANTIDILRKYGIAGLIAGGGAAATQQQPQQ